jgi:hypothetical protein
MSSKKGDFKISRNEAHNEDESVKIDNFVSGQEPETTKTFRISVRLSRELKIHAAKIGHTEKEIIVRLIEDYLASNRTN